MIDKKKLRERLLAVWQYKCYSMKDMAEHIGVSVITLRRFVYQEGSIHTSTLMKIDRYVADLEFDHGIES